MGIGNQTCHNAQEGHRVDLHVGRLLCDLTVIHTDQAGVLFVHIDVLDESLPHSNPQGLHT